MPNMTYTVLVYEAEEGGYWAEVAEMPGCVSQGETLDELKANITEAILACRGAYAENEGALEPAAISTWTLRIPDGDSVPA